jgi:predicted membrane GTPase involved in stress response
VHPSAMPQTKFVTGKALALGLRQSSWSTGPSTVPLNRIEVLDEVFRPVSSTRCDR